MTDQDQQDQTLEGAELPPVVITRAVFKLPEGLAENGQPMLPGDPPPPEFVGYHTSDNSGYSAEREALQACAQGQGRYVVVNVHSTTEDSWSQPGRRVYLEVE